MVVAHQGGDPFHVWNGSHRRLAAERVQPDASPRLRVQMSDRILPGVLRETDHSRVTEHRREHELGLGALGQSHLGADLASQMRDPEAVIVEVSPWPCP